MRGLIGQFAAAPIPPEQLARIDVPTTLIWGRDDLATALPIAQAAAARHGWPLQVIDDAGDDPVLDQPDAFLDALRTALAAARAVRSGAQRSRSRDDCSSRSMRRPTGSTRRGRAPAPTAAVNPLDGTQCRAQARGSALRDALVVRRGGVVDESERASAVLVKLWGGTRVR
ncbi:MAG: alpha/beta fold hydrolase [Frankiaceae bacterium]